MPKALKVTDPYFVVQLILGSAGWAATRSAQQRFCFTIPRLLTTTIPGRCFQFSLNPMTWYSSPLSRKAEQANDEVWMARSATRMEAIFFVFILKQCPATIIYHQ